MQNVYATEKSKNWTITATAQLAELAQHTAKAVKGVKLEIKEAANRKRQVTRSTETAKEALRPITESSRNAKLLEDEA